MTQEYDDLQRQLHQLDTDFVRVLEDLIDTLIQNGSLRLSDLPIQAQEKLNRRKKTRKRLSDALDLLSDDEGLL